MLRTMLSFELRQQLGNPVLWIVAVVFALLAFGASSSDAVQLGGSIGNINRNAPSTIVTLLSGFSSLSMLLVAIFVAGTALRDFDNRTAELFFTTPVHKRDYLLGRFGGGLFACCVVMAAVAIGMFVGYFMPWVDAARMGPHSAAPYLWSLFVIVIPNLFFIAAALFCLAVTTRSMLATYIGVIAFFALSAVMETLTADLDARWVGGLLDPFGGQAIINATRYWSTVERNTQLPDLGGVLLLNRLIWSAVAAGLLWLAYRLFRTDREGFTLRRRKAKATAIDLAAPTPATVPQVTLQTGSGAQWRQFLHQAWFDTRGVLRGAPLLVMLGFGMMILIISLMFTGQIFGTELYPTTARMSQSIAGAFNLFLLIVVTFYAGELIWRERSMRVAEVTDAFPNADWIPLAAKLVALTAVVLLFYASGIVVTMGYQLSKGYTHLQPLLYLQQMLINTSGFVMLAALALAVQVLSNNKFIGYLLMVVYIISRIALGILDFDDNLYRPFGAPAVPYSDMNGFGHFLPGFLWFRLYWGAFAGLLLLASLLMWVRGNRSVLNERIKEARRRFGIGQAITAALLLATFIGSGMYVRYNTKVLAADPPTNEYLAGDDALDRQADYERAYRQYKGDPQPRITSMRSDVDIYPAERRVRMRGSYRLVNHHDAAIDVLHVEIPRGLITHSLSFGEHSVELDDPIQGVARYRLNTPLAAGAELNFDFDLEYFPRGFGNDAGPTQVVENGTFFNNGVMPVLGYNESREMQDRNERRKRDLGDVPRMAKIDDEAARANTYLRQDADWVDFETTVSTSEDQIALAPGYLQREWTEKGRRYFHYKMDVPMLPFAAWLSARWEVKRGEWKGIPIEVYYHPTHAFNVDRMIEAAQKSFDYYNVNFTPYQHKQLRIIEFPGYSSFAQAFANTVPYSEAIGFVADLRKQEDIDYVFYVTAHEVAHQWWAHQVIGANVQGSTMLSESLSQYSALMVMEKEYGRHQMRRFLKYELDLYLQSRAGELIEELPLALVENQQYIHYRKGSLVFYALKEAIGEETLNAVLKRFLEDKGYQQPPYTTSREFLAYLREGTDPKHHPLIADLFEKIVFHDNRVKSAKAVKRDDGKYLVTLELHSSKVEAAGKGEETKLNVDDSFQIGIFARPKGGEEVDETVLYLQRHPINSEATTLEIVVDGEPYDAGIDPYNTLIDRDSNDNRRRVDVE